MARTQRKSGTAAEHNDDAEETRQEARSEQSNVIDLDASKKAAARVALIIRLADAAEELRLKGKAINEERKAIFDQVDACGINRAAFKAMLVKRRMEEEKRLAYDKAQKEIARAFGWDDGAQGDMFHGEQSQDDLELEHSNALAAAVADKWAGGDISDDDDDVDNRDGDSDDAMFNEDELEDDPAVAH